MPRRRKSSTAEDFIDLVAAMPWWGGLLLALISFVALNAWAAGIAAPAVKPGAMHWLVLAPVLTAAKYVVPFFCVMGAIASIVRRMHRQGLAEHVATGQSAKVRDGMSWRDFEKLVGESYRQRGWQVSETGGGGADGGIDLVLRKHGKEKVLVQCKQWRSMKVGVAVVRELYGAMAAEGATGGVVVTSGRYTEEARRFAQGRNVELVDGEGVFGMLKGAGRGRVAQAAQFGPGMDSKFEGHRSGALNMEVVPTCSRCSGQMIRRTARSGVRAGSKFWGCAGFPKCKGSV